MTGLSLLVFILLEATWSLNEGPFVDRLPIELGKPFTMRCSLKQMAGASINRTDFNVVKAVAIKRIRDAHELQPAPLYQIGIYSEPTISFIKQFAGREEEIEGSLYGIQTLEFPEYRYLSKWYLGVVLEIKNATCNDIGMVYFFVHAENTDRPFYDRGKLSKIMYLDTEDMRPWFVVSPPRDDFKNGTKVEITCTMRSTLKTVDLELYILVEPQFHRLPTEARYLDGDEGMWPKEGPYKSYAKVYGPCERVEYFQHWIKFSFVVESERMRTSMIVCLADLKATGIPSNFVFEQQFIRSLILKNCVDKVCSGDHSEFETIVALTTSRLKADKINGLPYTILVSVVTLIALSFIVLVSLACIVV